MDEDAGNPETDETLRWLSEHGQDLADSMFRDSRLFSAEDRSGIPPVTAEARPSPSQAPED